MRTSQWWQRRAKPLVRFALDVHSPPCHTFDVRLKNEGASQALTRRDVYDLVGHALGGQHGDNALGTSLREV